MHINIYQYIIIHIVHGNKWREIQTKFENEKSDNIFFKKNNYIQENYGEEAKEVFDPKWLGHISWEKDNKKYYYSKTLRFDVLVEEELIITTNEYRQYW